MDPDVQGNQRNQRQALSAVLDGDAADVDLALRAWREDPQSRADWHAYHLIGEVMRSDETHAAPQRDAEFLRRLRERLAAEPVVLAPGAAARHHERPPWVRRAWAVPGAIAAGFLAVAGLVVVAGVTVPGDMRQDRLANATGTANSAATVSAQAGTAAASAMPVAPGEGVLIRDAELDRYLAAHKQYTNSSVLAVPGGAVRNAAATAPGR